MENKILILDFDAYYKNAELDAHAIVLSAGYENAQTFDVRKFKTTLDANVDAYSAEWNNLMQQVPENFRDTLKANEATFFRACISPLARWMEAIDHFMEQNTVTEIIFSSFTDNDKIFVYEAEGEINKKLLYQGNAYFPYYLKQYIQHKFGRDITVRATQGRGSIRRKHKLRNLILFHFIVLKQFFFKVTTFKRNYGIAKKHYKTLISSRAVVQSEFISNYQKVDQDSVLIVNEQSFSLLKHLKFLKGSQKQFLYAEGLVSFGDLFRIQSNYFRDLRGAKKMKQLGINFQGIRWTCDLFLPDMLTKGLDYTFYSTSVKNAIQKYTVNDQPSILLSFEMFTAYAHYLKRITGQPTCQVQTTLIEPVRNADFVGSDFFYFTNPITYADFIAQNAALQYKLGCIPYLKYFGSEKKQPNDSIRSIVYFSQPIDLEEENSIIAVLEQFCTAHSVQLTIKPHPRQVPKFDLISEQTIIAGPSSDVERIILDSDMVITRSSSIGLDAWIYGVPPMFPKLNKPLQSHNIFYAPNDYAGTVFTLEKLEETLGDYEALKNNFFSHPLYRELNQTQTAKAGNLFKV